MSDVTLTSGIRSNLLALTQTSNDLTTTQQALATGKKVNSAADNPSSYFTSQNLTQTANNLSNLLTLRSCSLCACEASSTTSANARGSID